MAQVVQQQTHGDQNYYPGDAVAQPVELVAGVVAEVGVCPHLCHFLFPHMLIRLLSLKCTESANKNFGRSLIEWLEQLCGMLSSGNNGGTNTYLNRGFMIY